MPHESRSGQFRGKALATVGKTSSCLTTIFSTGIGLYLVALGVAGFVDALTTPQPTDGRNFMFISGGVFCLLGLLLLFLWTGRRIHAYPEGLVIEKGRRTEVPWEDIESIRTHITKNYRNNIFFMTRRHDNTRIECEIRLKNGKSFTIGGLQGWQGTNNVTQLIKIMAKYLAGVPSATIYPLKEHEITTTRFWIPRF